PSDALRSSSRSVAIGTYQHDRAKDDRVEANQPDNGDEPIDRLKKEDNAQDYREHSREYEHPLTFKGTHPDRLYNLDDPDDNCPRGNQIEEHNGCRDR